MREAKLTACLLALVAMSARADDYPRNPDIDILNYTFRIRLNDQNDIIRALSSIDLRFTRDGVSEFTIDLIGKANEAAETGMVVDSVTNGNGTELQFSHLDHRIRIRLASPSEAGERRTIAVAYHGVPEEGLVIAQNKHGDRTFFGDNFPDRGRHWLASIDHPYEKATCDFIITAPDHYQVIANGLPAEETHLGDGMQLTHWRQSVPISTYLMVIGVARFAVQYVDRIGDVSLQTWVYHQDRDAGFHDFARSRKFMLTPRMPIT